MDDDDDDSCSAVPAGRMLRSRGRKQRIDEDDDDDLNACRMLRSGQRKQSETFDDDSNARRGLRSGRGRERRRVDDCFGENEGATQRRSKRLQEKRKHGGYLESKQKTSFARRGHLRKESFESGSSLILSERDSDGSESTNESVSDVEFCETSESVSSESSSKECSSSSGSRPQRLSGKRSLRRRNVDDKGAKGTTKCSGPQAKRMKGFDGAQGGGYMEEKKVSEVDDGNNFDKKYFDGFKDGVLCSICEVGVADNFLLRCIGVGCSRAFHTFCCLPPLKELERDWLCFYCKGELSEDHKYMPKKFQKILGYRQINLEHKEIGMQEQFLLKWHSLSHHHDTWVPLEWIYATDRLRIYKYWQNNPHMNGMVTIDQRQPEWFKIDRVICCRRKGSSGNMCEISSYLRSNQQNEDFEYLVKWMGLDYCDATWESSLSEELLAEVNRLAERHKKATERNDINSHKTVALQFDNSPGYLGGALYGYQLEGLNWLLNNFTARRNVILADEMGLGKTIQVVSFILCLKQEKVEDKPFLILAPKSTLLYWEKEFRQWAPTLNVIIYQGDKETRRCIKLHELFTSEKSALFDVLVTNYELVLFDKSILRKFTWSSIIIDEGHKIKNIKCKLGLLLKRYTSDFRLLMTGTPLQNSLLELFTLLHFLDPAKFSDPEDDAKSFSEIGSGIHYEESLKIAELHELLRPRMLRRMKCDVLPGHIPAKKWVEVPCALTYNQREVYIAILEENYNKLNEGIHNGKKIVLNFILMQLKKCCNHPYLFPGQEQSHPSKETVFASMIASSGKLQLLEKLLPKLKKRGNRVLLFAQMTAMLDILEDFIVFLGLTYFRIDGGTSTSLRQQQMSEFNDPQSEVFLFLISTRAGGLGINLPSADRVIIYDPDFNPFMDLQAQSRAHRIGQLRPVVVYQLITKGTVEEKILWKSKNKLAVENLVMNYSKKPGVEELNSIILHGAKKILSRRNTLASTIQFDDDAIEALFKLDPAPDEKCISDDNGYLGSIQSFDNFGKADDEPPPPSPKADDWEKILGPVEAPNVVDFGRGKRQKKVVRYDSEDASDKDDIYSPESKSTSNSSNESGSEESYDKL